MAFTCMKFPWELGKFALVFFHGPICSSRSHPTFSAAISAEKAALLQTPIAAGAEAELGGPAGKQFNVMGQQLDSNRLLTTGQCPGWQTEAKEK